MRWHWVVNCDNTVDDPLVTSTADLDGTDESEFWKGRFIEGWSGKAWLAPRDQSEDGDPDDVLQNHLDLPVYSERLRAALDRAGISDIQYLPIRVFKSDQTEIVGFSVANVLAVVPALDLAKSDYDVFPPDDFLPQRRGRIRAVRRPTLLRGALMGRDVIRLLGYHYSLYVSDQFKRVFEEGRFTGYSFREVPISDAH